MKITNLLPAVAAAAILSAPAAFAFNPYGDSYNSSYYKGTVAVGDIGERGAQVPAGSQVVRDATSSRAAFLRDTNYTGGAPRKVDAKVDVHVHKDQKPGDVTANGESGSSLR